MQRETLGQFLQRANVYEHTPVSIDPALRRGAWLSWLMTSIYWVFYRYLPDGSVLVSSPFFRWTRRWLADTWDFVADHRQVFLTACVFVFSMILVLLAMTRGFRVADIRLQIALFTPVIFAAINLPFIVTLLLPVLVNMLLWFCLATLVLIAGVALLGALFWMASR